MHFRVYSPVSTEFKRTKDLAMNHNERQELIRYIRDTKQDIAISRKLGNHNIADNLAKALHQAERDLTASVSRNCRFRHREHGSSVIITIRPGQRLNHHQYSRTDEGWSSCSITWELSADGTELRREITSDGCDCDGRLTHYTDQVADAFRLGESRWPHWINENEYIYDQFAQAAKH